MTDAGKSIVDAHDLPFMPLYWVLRNNKLWIRRYKHGPAPQTTTCSRFVKDSSMRFHSFPLCNDEYCASPYDNPPYSHPTHHFCPIFRPPRLALYQCCIVWELCGQRWVGSAIDFRSLDFWRGHEYLRRWDAEAAVEPQNFLLRVIEKTKRGWAEDFAHTRAYFSSQSKS